MSSRASAAAGATKAHNLLRALQLLTLIPAWAILAAVVAWYNGNGVHIPGGILCLFIATLLSFAWAFCILVAVLRADNTALWIAFWDVVALGALIAGVATTADIANYQCNAVAVNTTPTVYITSNGERIVLTGPNAAAAAPAASVVPQDQRSLWVNPNNCNLIKAAWGLAIADVVMFFLTAMLAVVIYKQNEDLRRRDVVVVEDDVAGVEKVYLARPKRAHRGSRRSSTTRTSRSSRSRARSGSRGYGYDDRL